MSDTCQFAPGGWCDDANCVKYGCKHVRGETEGYTNMKTVILKIDAEVLAMALRLPQGVRVVDAHMDFSHPGIVLLRLTGAQFAEVPAGCCAPEVTAEFETHQVPQFLRFR